MKWLFSVHWVLAAALWYFGNGVLHDVFVLMKHKGEYDRELLSLLTVGHILLLSGAVVFVSYLMIMNKIQYGGIIGIIIGIGMLIYCAMIFPFLRSFGTILISLMLIISSIRAVRSLL